MPGTWVYTYPCELTSGGGPPPGRGGPGGLPNIVLLLVGVCWIIDIGLLAELSGQSPDPGRLSPGRHVREGLLDGVGRHRATGQGAAVTNAGRVAFQARCAE